ncbi:MAG: ComEA family DNA-binding protein [Cyanobacteria bacterium J06598_3]
MFKKFLQQVGIHPLQRRLQQEPYYRFQSVEELQLAASWGVRIDANTASVDDWLRLPGLSIYQARRLSELTGRGLAFNCLEDVAAALEMRSQQIQPWQAILQFCYYSAEPLIEPASLNANTATAEELATIPAVDVFLGRAIVHYRKNGPYQDLADLQRRLRLTVPVTAELLHYVRFK